MSPAKTAELMEMPFGLRTQVGTGNHMLDGGPDPPTGRGNFEGKGAAARLVTGARRRDHITPVLRQLHWLPVRQRVTFKVAVLVHQSLAGAAPAYLADDCHLLSDAGRRPLRSHSNDIRKLLVTQQTW